jgi:hypothetical protein
VLVGWRCDPGNVALRFFTPVKRPRKVDLDRTPDVRDGLTRIERVILWQLSELQKERHGRDVPTAMLYGRVVEHVDISVDELQRTLQRLIGTR